MNKTHCLRWRPPRPEHCTYHTATVWYSRCRRYRVVGQASVFDPGHLTYTASRDKTVLLGTGYDSLDDAFHACHKDFQKNVCVPLSRSTPPGDNECVARRNSKTKGRKDMTAATATKNPMNLSLSQAVKTLLGCGYNTADSMSEADLAKWLNQLDESSATDRMDDDTRIVFNNVCKALEDGRPIGLKPSGVKEEEPKAKKTAKPDNKSKEGKPKARAGTNGNGHSKTAAPKDRKAAKPDKPAKSQTKDDKHKNPAAKNAGGVERNRFGTKVGTKSARIDSCFTAEPIHLIEVEQKTGFDQRMVWVRANILLQKGFLTKNPKDHTYRLTAKGKKGKGK